jgi:hypothetical protein
VKPIFVASLALTKQLNTQKIKEQALACERNTHPGVHSHRSHVRASKINFYMNDKNIISFKICYCLLKP